MIYDENERKEIETRLRSIFNFFIQLIHFLKDVEKFIF